MSFWSVNVDYSAVFHLDNIKVCILINIMKCQICKNEDCQHIRTLNKIKQFIYQKST